MDVFRCAHCGATGLMARMDDFQCLHCGNCTMLDGTPRPVEPVFAGGPRAFDRRPK